MIGDRANLSGTRGGKSHVGKQELVVSTAWKMGLLRTCNFWSLK